jgi:hypothetical protein
MVYMSSVGSCDVRFCFIFNAGASSEAAIEDADAVLLGRARFRDMVQDFDSCTQYVNERKWWWWKLKVGCDTRYLKLEAALEWYWWRCQAPKTRSLIDALGND